MQPESRNESAETVRFGIGTFSRGAHAEFPGVVLEDRVVPVADFASYDSEVGGYHSVIQILEDWEQTFDRLQSCVRGFLDEHPEVRPLQKPSPSVFDSYRVHAPVHLPRQVFCSGANYRKHVIDLIVDTDTPSAHGLSPDEKRAAAEALMDKRAAEGRPYIFCKTVSAVCGAYDRIELDAKSTQPDWELELAVVIGKQARHVREAEALDYVAGYTMSNDITNRDRVWCRNELKPLGTDWFLGKCSPRYLPLGPYLLPARFAPDPQNLDLELRLNGERMQHDNTSDMIFGVARLVEFVSEQTVLWPGDVICTGSPAGNGTHYGRFLQSGDVMECTIEGLGVMRNQCVRTTASPAQP